MDETESLIRRLVRGLVAVAMGLLLLALVRSCTGSEDGAESEGEEQPIGEAPLLAASSIQIRTSRDQPPAQIACGRIDHDQSPYVIRVLDMNPSINRFGVHVALVRTDGSQQDEVVDVTANRRGTSSSTEVAGDADADDFIECRIVAIQTGTRLIRTGR